MMDGSGDLANLADTGPGRAGIFAFHNDVKTASGAKKAGTLHGNNHPTAANRIPNSA